MGWEKRVAAPGVGGAAKKAEGVKGEEVDGEEGSVPVPVPVLDGPEEERRLNVSMITLESTKVGGGLGSVAIAADEVAR